MSTDDLSPYQPFQQSYQKQTQTASAGTPHISRQKVVRDGFSMPQQDYRLIGETQSCLFQAGLVVTKSGILRAALHALHQLPIENRLRLIQGLEPIKTGRPEGKRSQPNYRCIWVKNQLFRPVTPMVESRAEE